MERVLAKVEKICGKENMEAFYTKLKENLASSTKENEKKNLSFQIKGGETTPAGIGIQISSVNKEGFATYIPEEKDYMKDAVSILTASISIKDASQAGVVEQLFNQFKPMIDEIEFIKPYLESKKVEYYLRIIGTKVCVDVVFKDEVAFKKLQEMGVDFSQYQCFKFLFKTNLKANEALNLTLKEIVEKVLSLVLSFDASSTNAKYLITALAKTLDSMEGVIKEEKQKKRLKKLQLFMSGILAFVNANLNVQFDPKALTETLLEKSPFLAGSVDEINEGIEGGKAMLDGFGGETAKGMLEGFGVYEQAKAALIDDISISILSNQYKNGFAFNINLPGVTQFVNEKFLSA